MLKAFVFDFDGVIVDTESEWYYIYRDWLKEVHHYDLKMEDYLVCVGASSSSLFAFLEKEIGPHLQMQAFEQQAMQEFIARTSTLPAMEGVKEFIQEAKQRGFKLAIATSATLKKPQFHLKRLHLLEYFDAFSTAELSEHIKPAPDIFLKAAELLGVQPHECLAIEDSANGLLAAKRAHMPCLIVPNKITQCSDFQGYYRLVPSLKDIHLDEIIHDFSQP